MPDAPAWGPPSRGSTRSPAPGVLAENDTVWPQHHQHQKEDTAHCPLTDGRTDKTGCLRAAEYYSAVKRREVPMGAARMRSLTPCSREQQTRKAPDKNSPEQDHSGSEQMAAARGWEGQGVESA